MRTVGYKDVLATPMRANGADAETVGEYLVVLLHTLWLWKDEFSGKRPFGNNGWEYEVYEALVSARLVSGELDEDGYVIEFDQEEADKLIKWAILHLYSPE